MPTVGVESSTPCVNTLSPRPGAPLAPLLYDSPTVIYWTSPCVSLGVSGLFCCFYSIFLWKILSANSIDPDETPHYLASDLGLHCLHLT